jgi:outer membrane protein OmpA-like peptidoglycan-associated protein
VAATAPRAPDEAAPDAQPPADSPGQVHVTVSDECGLLLDQIYFDQGSTSPHPRQRPILDETAAMFRCFLRTGEITKWQVVGNTDDTERDPTALSLARAQAVADELIARGVDAATLDVTGVGAAQPQDRRRTPAARAKNRRVFFLVLQRGATSP